MNGLELARLYYEEVGLPALQKELPELVERMAFGLAGEGSECFGYDDELSRDHDWGPGFCIWLEDEDYQHYGEAVQAIYDRLPDQFHGFPVRRNTPWSVRRVGCLNMREWFRYYTGFPEGPVTAEEWLRVPEFQLAAVTNGQVFSDERGTFTAIRNRLLNDCPEDVRLRRIVQQASAMAQAGQYNYTRCVRRGDRAAAELAMAEFLKAAMTMCYLLNRRHAPYYKWLHRGMKELPALSRIYDRVKELCAGEGNREDQIEGICVLTAAELRRQGLSTSLDDFLLAHCPEIAARIQDPRLRRTNMEENGK